MQKNRARILLSIGLISLFGSLAVKEATDIKMPDFIYGFFIGLGIVLVIGSQFIKKPKAE